MKGLPKWLVPAVVVLSLIGILASVYFSAEKTQVFASGTIEIDRSLEEKAEGLRHLFIVIYDADGTVHMPYAAQRELLKDDAKGRFLKFFLTRERLQIMNEGRPIPRRMRLKVRLDRDGVAGMDQPGDLVGEVTGITFAQEGVAIEIDKFISDKQG